MTAYERVPLVLSWRDARVFEIRPALAGEAPVLRVALGIPDQVELEGHARLEALRRFRDEGGTKSEPLILLRAPTRYRGANERMYIESVDIDWTDFPITPWSR